MNTKKNDSASTQQPGKTQEEEERGDVYFLRPLRVIYRNQYFIDAQTAILKPFASRFTHNVDLGLGISLGFGRFFGMRSAVSMGIEYDIYSALYIRYKYLWHFERPYLSMGPSVEIRSKTFDLLPWDNYIQKDEIMPKIYYQVGYNVVFPMNRNALYVGAHYMGASKPFVKLVLGFLIVGPFY